jgi:hypothetical protein
MKRGGTAQLPVWIVDAENLKEISLNANICSNGVAPNWGFPLSLPIQDGNVVFPLQVPDSVTAGNYTLVIARSWRVDIRTGMPRPCTPAIKWAVLPKF